MNLWGKKASSKPAKAPRRPSTIGGEMPGRYTALGYRATKIADRDGRSPSHGSGDVHAQISRVKLIGQSREFVRDNAIYRGMLNSACRYIVGTGFNLVPKTNRPATNRKIEELWRQFWTRPEARGLVSGAGFERMVCTELLTCGDTLVLKLKGGTLQHIESEQLVSATDYYGTGITVDAVGAPRVYHVAPYDNGFVQAGKAKAKKAEDVIYVVKPERPSSTRGVPPCQSAFPMIHRINDVCDSEAIAWQMLARMALAVNREDAGLRAVSDSEAPADTYGTRIQELDYALIFHGEPGDTISGVERNIPGQNFSESLVMFLRLLGLPLGLPLELILLDWTKSNYSQSRAVMEQAYQNFLEWQSLLESFFLAPIYEWQIRRWVASKLIPDSKDAASHEWIKPTFPWIDQLKEAQAWGAKVDRGFVTYRHVCKSLNLDPVDVLNARDVEVREAIARAQSIEKDTKVSVPWQIFAGMEPPKESAKAAAPEKGDKTVANK